MANGIQGLGDWGVRLVRESKLALFGTPWAALLDPPVDASKLPVFSEFRDEAGHRRSIDSYLLAHLAVAPHLAPQPPADAGPDIRWWSRVASPQSRFGFEDAASPTPWLVRERDSLTIETWTQSELCCLHALSHAGESARPRVNAAADWMIENLQPDNATNHPWAIHVFLRRAAEIASGEHRLYAEALFHNAIISLGRADRFSALILLDAGRWLSQHAHTEQHSAR